MAIKTYIGEVYEGRWKVVAKTMKKGTAYYLLENIYNKSVVEVCSKTIWRISKGETSISNVISMRIAKNRKGVQWNYLGSNSGARKLAYGKRKDAKDNIKSVEELL